MIDNQHAPDIIAEEFVILGGNHTEDLWTYEVEGFYGYKFFTLAEALEVSKDMHQRGCIDENAKGPTGNTGIRRRTMK